MHFFLYFYLSSTSTELFHRTSLSECFLIKINKSSHSMCSHKKNAFLKILKIAFLEDARWNLYSKSFKNSSEEVLHRCYSKILVTSVGRLISWGSSLPFKKLFCEVDSFEKKAKRFSKNSCSELCDKLLKKYMRISSFLVRLGI